MSANINVSTSSSLPSDPFNAVLESTDEPARRRPRPDHLLTSSIHHHPSSVFASSSKCLCHCGRGFLLDEPVAVGVTATSRQPRDQQLLLQQLVVCTCCVSCTDVVNSPTRTATETIAAVHPCELAIALASDRSLASSGILPISVAQKAAQAAAAHLEECEHAAMRFVRERPPFLCSDDGGGEEQHHLYGIHGAAFFYFVRCATCGFSDLIA